MTLSVMITTKNRAADLCHTITVLKQLSPAPNEILITTDGCTDNTIEVVKAELPEARLFVNEVGQGSVASRDRMMREARCDLVMSLDDDSYPEQRDCIEKIVLLFNENPKLAVLHFPQRTDEFPETLLQKDFGPPRKTRSFANSGAILRRSAYLKLHGFEPHFFHAYEEPDYALQCHSAEFEVLFTPSVTIRHHYSPQSRSEIRTHHRHARNEFCSTLMRCPFPQMPLILIYRMMSQLRYAFTRGITWVFKEPLWWIDSVKSIPWCIQKREPVKWASYRAWLKLK